MSHLGESFIVNRLFVFQLFRESWPFALCLKIYYKSKNLGSSSIFWTSVDNRKCGSFQMQQFICSDLREGHLQLFCIKVVNVSVMLEIIKEVLAMSFEKERSL